MRLTDGRLSVSPTDLANFLACRHKTRLDSLVARGELDAPRWVDPLTEVLRQRGDQHEQRYVATLRTAGRSIADVHEGSAESRIDRTRQAMREGHDVILQAALSRDGWLGFADVLVKVDRPSPIFGAWSYEAHDTKLARETRGGTILQLCVYTELLGAEQGVMPERFEVVTPVERAAHRFEAYGAYYRGVKRRFLAFVEPDGDTARADTYPEPVEHCAVCRWAGRCDRQRRGDDHLSLVANLSRSQQSELESRGVKTLAALAALPVPLPFAPKRGGRGAYERVQHQARLQLEQRTANRPVFELLPIEAGRGLAVLPEPRLGDLFLDLEGDPFGRPVIAAAAGEGNREYLFGLGRRAPDGSFSYRAWWAFTDGEERAAFEAVVAEIMAARRADPAAYVYHYGAYERATFGRLAGRHATCEADWDRLLRAGAFVDLYAIVRHAVRAGVESYSIKALEPFYGFARDVPLDEAGFHRQLVEIALETGDPASLSQMVRGKVEGYNRDDCRSTLELRHWLEALRQRQVDAGLPIARPVPTSETPSEDVSARDAAAAALRGALLAGVPDEAGARTSADQARYLLAYLVDWHRREDRVAWGEYHRLRERPFEELFDEPLALVGLTFLERLPAASPRTKRVTDRYAYPGQESDLVPGDKLKLLHDEAFGEVAAVDRLARTIDIQKALDQTDVHPLAVITLRIIDVKQLEESIKRVAARVIADGLEAPEGRLVRDLLEARPPRVRTGAFVAPPRDRLAEGASQTALDLDESLLGIQGPPGAGKTFTGAHMIAALVAAGRKVGVVANTHKVIRKLLVDAGRVARQPIRLARKFGDRDVQAAAAEGLIDVPENRDARAWLEEPGPRVLGGTAFMWSRPEFAGLVDILFVEEAGQMSLANVLAVSPATHNLVLLGDPQQLDQPLRGSHPDGVDVSALDHLLGGHQTMPDGHGLFLPLTWRLAPAICAFTSEVFYEGKLHAKAGLERQRLVGWRPPVTAGPWASAAVEARAGLFTVEVEHDGCRTASDDEADVVVALVRSLLAPGVSWVDEHEVRHPMTRSDILVVAPYNAHVARIQERLAEALSEGPAVSVGTVDRFQGQEAAVVIFSMATSRPEDAPRGMEFLYSLHRLNVATSRARCVCLLVANRRLFEPECKSPWHMQLANGLARYRELAS